METEQISVKEAIVLGIVEGLTEFLPVSSTGHLILTVHILGIPHTEFIKSFEISIQLGSIMAILFLYKERFVRDYELWKRIVFAFIPTGAVGFVLYKLIKEHLIGNDLIVTVNLFIGGIVLILADRHSNRFKGFEDVTQMPLWRVFIIGLFQSIAVVPGVSRSGATIIGGMFMGLSRKSAAEFSFILAVPTMFAATGYDLTKSGASFSAEQWKLLTLGFLTAFITAFFTVKTFISFLEKHGFTLFGIYRILISFIYGSIFLL